MSWIRTRGASCAAIAVIAALMAVGPANAGTPQPGFQDELFANAPLGTGLAFTPDGTLLVTSLTGQLTAVEQDGTARQIGDLSDQVCLGRERGLYAVAVDPEFSENRLIYVTYSRKRPDVACEAEPAAANRLSRFTLGEDLTLDRASETVLLDEITSPGWIHNAGDLEFGKDGYLYVTTGDGGCEGANNFRCGSGNRAASFRNELRGKILRIEKDGDVPPDNPFTGPGTARCNLGAAPVGTTCQEIWALGLRNPFRFAHDPDAIGVRMFINDVGLSHWEEVNEGRATANFGWPVREGACVTGSFTNCPPPGEYTDPIHAYRHDDSGCVSITGGAFVPAAAWPPPWAGSYIFADYGCSKLFLLRPSGSTWVREDFLTDGWLPIDLTFGPVDGGRPALYYTQLFEGGGSIRRIRFTGPANRPPAAELEADETRGALPLEVTFDAGGTSDPDGDAITYEFDFGDGSEKVTGAASSATHTYTTKGHYVATVTARDPAGLSSAAEVQIDAGFLPPQIQIVAPPASETFDVGERIELRAEASDPEDGELAGSAISWNVLLHHDNHTHPYAGPATGSSLEVTGPAPETVPAMNTSYLEVYATATDSDGLTTTAFRRIDPRRVRISLGSNLPSTPITVNRAPFTTPAAFHSWAGWELSVSAAPQHMLHTFKRWTDGPTANPRIIKPTSPTTLSAEYGLLGL